MAPTCSRLRKSLLTAGRPLLVTAVALLGACESPTATEPGPEPLLQTVAHEYGFEPVGGGAQELSVRYTFHNSTAAPVLVGNCNGVFSHGLERLTDQGWQRSWSASLLLCRSEPIEIAPGERWSGEVVVRAVSATALSGAELALADDLSGTYRLVWDVPTTDGPAGEEVLAKDLRVSNPFRVRLP